MALPTRETVIHWRADATHSKRRQALCAAYLTLLDERAAVRATAFAECEEIVNYQLTNDLDEGTYMFDYVTDIRDAIASRRAPPETP